MTLEQAGILGVSAGAVLSVIVLSMMFAVLRLAIGPTLPDRVVALDVVANLAVGAVAGCAIAFDEPTLLEPALVVAIIAFLGTVAFARYLEGSRP